MTWLQFLLCVDTNSFVLLIQIVFISTWSVQGFHLMIHKACTKPVICIQMTSNISYCLCDLLYLHLWHFTGTFNKCAQMKMRNERCFSQ